MVIYIIATLVIARIASLLEQRASRSLRVVQARPVAPWRSIF
jgi:hypothetical protein